MTTGAFRFQTSVYAEPERRKERRDAFRPRARRQTQARTAPTIGGRGSSRFAMGGVPPRRSPDAALRPSRRAAQAARLALCERGRSRPALAGAAPGRRGRLKPRPRAWEARGPSRSRADPPGQTLWRCPGAARFSGVRSGCSREGADSSGRCLRRARPPARRRVGRVQRGGWSSPIRCRTRRRL
jgi:hypothetical protein